MKKNKSSFRVPGWAGGLLAAALFAVSSTGADFDYFDLSVIRNLGSENPNPRIEFDRLAKLDFNGDGVADVVRCSTAAFVRIFDGGNGQKIFEWEGPSKQIVVGSDSWTRAMSRCEVVELVDGVPAVVVSNFWNIPGWRAPAPQYVVYRKPSGNIVTREINVNGFGKYKATARSVQCAPYPARLRNQGFRDGTLCFFPAYEWGEHTHTALLKLELDSGAELVAKDLTGTSGLGPWSGGAAGTHESQIPRSNKCSGDSTRDGSFMMDGTFLDFDRNGLPDLVTVGQHASVRSHSMRIDSTRREGIRFVNDTIVPVTIHVAQEYLRVTALNKHEPKLRTSCVYVSGEKALGGTCGGGMRDHIQCFTEDGHWVTRALPVDVSSEMFSPVVKFDGAMESLILRTRVFGTSAEPRDLYLRLRK